MARYMSHLEELYQNKTFQRKLDYINYNFSKFFKNIDKKNSSILEIGPGLGEFIQYSTLRGIKNIDVLDNDENVFNFIKSKYKIQNSFLSNNITKLDKKFGSYDLIILIQVLEHIPRNQYSQVIRILFEHLKKSGYLIIVVPNANNPLGIVERYGDLQHENSFTTSSLNDLVIFSEIKNYEIEIKGYGIPPYGPVNILRIIMQKLLHAILLIVLVINGGVYYRPLNPNITLVIKKTN